MKQITDQEKYKLLINGSNDLMWSVDRDYKLIVANSAFINASKTFTKKNFSEGDCVIDDIGEERKTKWVGYYDRGLGGEYFSVIENLYNEVDNVTRHIKVTFSPIYTADKSIEGVGCYGKDITEEQVNLLNLKNSEEKFSKIMDSSLDMICTVDEEGYYVSVSKASERILGYKPEELVGKLQLDFIYEEDREETIKARKSILQGEYVTNFTNRYLHKDGHIVPLIWSSRWNDADRLRYGIARDYTEKLKAEEIIKNSEKKYRNLFQNNPSPMIIWDFETLNIVDCNEEALLKYGYSRDEFLKLSIRDIRPAEDVPLIEKVTKHEDLYDNPHKQIWRHKKKNGEIMAIDVTGHLIDYNGRRSAMVVLLDVTEKLKAEEKLRSSEGMLAEAQRIAKMGSWTYDFIFNTVTRSDELYNIYGIDRGSFYEKNGSFLRFVDKEDREKVTTTFKHAKKTGEPYKIEYRLTTQNGDKKIVEEAGYGKKDEDGRIIKMTGTVHDITERKSTEIKLNELNESLEKQKIALEFSNKELEQFAYIASHDLQEPLRMVTGFVSLLNNKYGDVLDEKGKMYISHAVDGASRMKTLILDLLEYSKVGHFDEPVEFIDLNILIGELKLFFSDQSGEISPQINCENLPLIKAHRSPLRQIFQNLIGNALKYKTPDVTPKVIIECRDSEDYWEFSVIDNGIGISEKYFDKIFVIFQRLHNKNEFSGTGIGLAMTKKIIESMGGTIWVESTIGKGSTFSFTIPKNQTISK